MGGAGSNQNVEGVEPVGDGGDGIGGAALVQIDGGTLNMFGGIGIRAEGNPRSPDPVLGTQAGQGGSAQGNTAGTGGTGTGGSAAMIVNGGNVLGQIANGFPAPFGVIVSATGYGGAGGGNDPFFFDTPEQLPFFENDSYPSPAGQPDVRLLSFPRSIDHAAHDGHIQRGRDGDQPPLYLASDTEKVDLAPAADRAGDHVRSAPAKSETVKDQIPHPDLLFRRSGQGDTDRVG